MNWESHRIQTATGLSRGIVYRLPRDRLLVKLWLGAYASRDSVFDSMAQLEKMIRRRRWRLQKVNWYE